MTSAEAGHDVDPCVTSTLPEAPQLRSHAQLEMEKENPDLDDEFEMPAPRACVEFWLGFVIMSIIGFFQVIETGAILAGDWFMNTYFIMYLLFLHVVRISTDPCNTLCGGGGAVLPLTIVRAVTTLIAHVIFTSLTATYGGSVEGEVLPDPEDPYGMHNPWSTGRYIVVFIMVVQMLKDITLAIIYICELINSEYVSE